jgi:hypothetical protein
MELTTHFSDIGGKIYSELSNAKYNIFVAVGFINDKALWDILIQKSKDGVVVQVVLFNEDIKKAIGLNIENFVKNGGHFFWNLHQHGFCVIDVKTVITGLYNWTFYQQKRIKMESIIIIKGSTDIAEQFSDEFKLLIKNSSRFKLPKEIIYVEKEVTVDREVIKEVEKQVIQKIPIIEKVVEEKIIKIREILKPANWYDNEEKRKLWWDTLNEDWKKVFNESVLGNKHDNLLKPNDSKLAKLFKLNRLDLTYYEKTTIKIKDLSGLESLTNVQEINLTGHKIKPHEIESILSLNPNCKLIGL